MAQASAATPSLGRRLSIALTVIAVTVAPALIMLVVLRLGTGEIQAAATWASMPAIAGLAAVVNGGRRFAIIVAIVMGFLAPVTIVAGSSPVSGAALMAVLCMTVGRLSRYGLHKSALLVPVMLAWPLINPPLWGTATTVDRTDTAYLIWIAIVFFVGGMVPALVGPYLLRRKDLPQPQTHSRAEAMPYTVIITALVTISTFYVLDHRNLYGGAFLIAAILVLAPIGTADALKPTFFRVLGTLIGSVFVLGIMSKVDSLAVVYLVGLVLIVFALLARLGPRGWIYYVFMMPASACLNATSLSQVGQLGEQRLVDNAVGGLLVIVTTAIAIAYSGWAARHGHTSAHDEETADLMDSVATPSPA